MKILISILLLVCILSFPVAGADLTKSGTTAAQFLKVQVGARATGMGGAYVALAKDATSLYWNPAGIVRAGERGAVNFGYTEWLAGTNLNFAGVVIQAGSFGALGLNFTALSMPDMLVRTEYEPEGTGEYFSAMDLAMGLSYARQITDRFAIGFTGKYIRQQIWHMTSSSIALDLGILFRTDLDWLTLGMSISNFGPKMQYAGKDIFINYDFNSDEWGDNENIFANLQTDKWELPLLFRFGLAFEILNQNPNQFTLSLEARHPNDNTESVSIGGEYGFMRRFFLRGGYQAMFERDAEKGLTLGMGVKYFLSPTAPLHFDYAWADWGRLVNTHRFSAEIFF